MPTIKFTHTYTKLLLNGTPVDAARLLDVQKVNIQDLSFDLLEYDTDRGMYKLPTKGEYMMLIFLKPGSEFHLFTTLRRFTPEKFAYYQANLSKVFDVVITQPEPAV